MLCKEDMDQDDIARHKHEDKDPPSSAVASHKVPHKNAALDRNQMEGWASSHKSRST